MPASHSRPPVTLNRAIHDYLRQLKVSGRAQATLESYGTKLLLIDELLRKPLLRRVRERSLQNALLQLEDGFASDQPRCPSTMNQIRSACRLFFHWCCNSGRLKHNPAEQIRLARVDQQACHPIHPDEVTTLFAIMRTTTDLLVPRDYALFSLYAFAGLRRNEALILRLDDLRFEERLVILPKTKAGGGNRRFLPARLRTIMQDYLSWRARDPDALRSPWLFPGRTPHAPLCARQAQLRFEFWRDRPVFALF